MNWTLAVQTLEVLAWPAVTVTAFVRLKKPIEGILERVKSIQIGQHKFLFERQMNANVQHKLHLAGHGSEAGQVQQGKASVNAEASATASATGRLATNAAEAAAAWSTAVVEALREAIAQGLALNPSYAPQTEEDLEFARQAVKAGQLRWSPFGDGVMLPTT